MNTFTVNVYTPEALVVSEEATYLGVPGSDGSYGLMYNHMPCLIALKEGTLELVLGEERSVFACGEGFLEIRDNRANVFVTYCDEVKA